MLLVFFVFPCFCFLRSMKTGRLREIAWLCGRIRVHCTSSDGAFSATCSSITFVTSNRSIIFWHQYELLPNFDNCVWHVMISKSIQFVYLQWSWCTIIIKLSILIFQVHQNTYTWILNVAWLVVVEVAYDLSNFEK